MHRVSLRIVGRFCLLWCDNIPLEFGLVGSSDMECSTWDLQFLVTWVHRRRQDLIGSGLTESQTRVDYPPMFRLILRPVADAPRRQIIS
jgi:hypothetical protein